MTRQHAADRLDNAQRCVQDVTDWLQANPEHDRHDKMLALGAEVLFKIRRLRAQLATLRPQDG